MAEKPTAVIPLTTLLSLLLAVLGGGLILVWLSLWTNTASIFAFAGDATDAFHSSVILFGIVSAAARLLCAVFGRRLDALLRKRSALVLAAAMTSASLPAVALTCVPDPSALLLAVRFIGLCCAALFGVVFLISCWVDIISEFDEAYMTPIVVASFFLFSLFYFTSIALPSALLIFIATGLPFAVCACFVLARANLPAESSEKPEVDFGKSRGRVLVILLALSTFFFGLVGQIVRSLTWSEAVGPYSAASSVYHEMGIFLAVIVLGVYVAFLRVKNQHDSHHVLGLACLFVVALGIVIPGVLREDCMPIADFALGIGLGCYQIQVYYYAAFLSRKTRESALVTFGVLFAPFELAGSVGLLVMDALIANSIMWSQTALVAVVVLFLLIFVVLLPFLKWQSALFSPDDSLLDEAQTQGGAESYAGDESRQDMAGLLDGAADFGGIVESSEQDFAAYGLTSREEEVARLLLQGRSIPFIQSDLSISEGTAKTHLLHIYRKCGVHNRQEFLSLFR